MKRHLQFQRCVEARAEIFARNFEHPELIEVRVVELGVQQHVTAINQVSDKVHERDLRGIGRAAEHAFAEERAAERDAIKAADELFAVPAFD